MMKQLILAFIFLFTTSLVKAEDREGYYVTLQGDTVKATIKRGGFVSNPEMEYLRVIIKDNSGKQTIFSPKDIIGYGFDYNEYYWHFRSKPTQKGDLRFLVVSFQTPKAKLFFYSKSRSLGYAVTDDRYYTLENEKGQYLFLENPSSLKKIKEKLIEFFLEYPKTIAVIESKFEKKKEIEQGIVEVMRSVNE